MNFHGSFPKAFKELGSPRTYGNTLVGVFSWSKDWKWSKPGMIDLQKGRKSWWDSSGATLGHMLVRIVTSELVEYVNTSSAG